MIFWRRLSKYVDISNTPQNIIITYFEKISATFSAKGGDEFKRLTESPIAFANEHFHNIVHIIIEQYYVSELLTNSIFTWNY